MIKERLYDSIDEIAMHYQKSNPKNPQLLEPLINLIKGLIAVKFTPENLDPKLFRINYEGELRSTQALTKAPWDYQRLWDFVFECCLKKNEEIFSLVLGKTELASSHPVYRNIVKAALESKDDKIESIIAQNQIKDDSVIRRLQELFSSITQLKENCLNDISGKYTILFENELLKQLDTDIEYYWAYHSGGQLILWPSAQKKVIEEVVKELNLQPRKI